MIHLLAILGLALLCAAWVALQLASGRRDEDSGGGCGTCVRKEPCESSARRGEGDRTDRP